MMSALMATADAMSVGWSPAAVTSVTRCASRVAVRGQAVCKQVAAGAIEEREPLPSIDTGSIVEFHDPSHGAGKNHPVLGLVQGCEFKAKGGARVNIIDADGGKHSVGEKALHIILPPTKKKETEPAEILKEYATVMEQGATELGVDPELLELAWSECVEMDKASFTPKSVVSLIDESLCKTPLQKYKAFRLLTSDLGKVFFKALGHNMYKAKTGKSVRVSKENWCRADDHAQVQEFCFV
jgi:hypothetical protein